ncbi:hypothetical protein [Streptomyces sp. NPDC087317]|uniref:hypothetical protein n=1 Tax=Streptomyces sp. NPDC087317 TaxID=3365784 RepID=UPI00381A354A
MMRDTDNVELSAAWDVVPDVAAAQGRYETAVKLRREFPRGKTPAEALTAVRDDAIARFKATGKWSATFAKDAAKAHSDAVAWQAEADALFSLEAIAKRTAEDLRDALSGDVLTHLGGRLAEILDAAKRAGEALGDVTSAEQAIEAGADALDAWRRLTGLLTDFRNVREAQWSVLRSVAGEDERTRLRQWRGAGHGEVQGVRLDDIPPHIADVMRSQAYSIEYLVWLARSGSASVPKSYDDLEFSVTAASEPVAYDDAGPLVDLSPRVTIERERKPLNTRREPRPFID